MTVSVTAVASVAVDRARACGSPTRVYLQPNNTVTLANDKQFATRMLWSILVGVYDASCPVEWIRDDIEAAIHERETICPACGQQCPQ